MESIELGQHAFVLHSRPYRENQLLVDLLTEYDGKVAAVVYSGKTQKSNKKQLLQPFTPLSVNLTGRSTLKKLSSIEAVNKGLQLTGNYLYSGFYLNELLVKLLPEHIPCDKLFIQYRSTLDALADKKSLEVNLRRFEMCLLEELGIALDFSLAYESDSDYLSFHQDIGFQASIEQDGAFNRLHIKDIAEHNYQSDAVLHSAKLLMRKIIDQLLGHRPLNSRKLFSK